MLRNIFLAAITIWALTAVVGGPIVVNEVALLVAIVTGVMLAVSWVRRRASKSTVR